MSPEPSNKKLYSQVKKEADALFLSKTGIYKSSWIVSEYKKRGGTYIGNKPKNSGLKRWYKEIWVDLSRPIKENGKIIGYQQCGRNSQKDPNYPLCRPLKKINSKTPLTVSEIDKTKLNELIKEKRIIKDKKNIKFKKIDK
jgi:hypothetical protein